MADHIEAELIPGTEILLASDEGYGIHSNTNEELVLVPTPSDQPDDPLNWSVGWKATVILNQAFFVFISVLTPLSIAPLTPIFMQEFHKTLTQVNYLFGAAAITLGYTNFIIVPFSNIFGRRPAILICGLVCVLANIWQALTTSYPSFIGARVISGFGAGANESIMPMVIADVMFMHQRGLWMGLYFWAYFLGTFIGPIISGNIAAHVSWRWFFWVCTIFQGVSLIMMIFMFPETLYKRPNLATSDHGSNHIRSLPERPVGRPSKHQFSLIPRPEFEDKDLVFRDILAPIQIFSFPIILWAAFSFNFAANCLLALNLTQSQVFAAPPYLFSPAQVGFVNFAFVVGGIIGLLTAGPFSDWISMRATARNKGVREPEMRLIALVPYVCICLVGMTVTAVGYQRHWPWQAVVVIGYGFVGIQVVSIPAILISYAIDSYRHIPGQIMLAGTIIKNSFGFGMIFYFNDWAAKDGFIPPVMTMMALTVGFTVIGMVVFMIWGKKFRRATMHSKLHTL
ncbi:MFS general substrate transporter [Hyaloscypha variabilis F]|uniref:MFS general substrate transporter n=1 Tax=Hyaloscypha variabilis (strain UAMH 11265 / GT02V1 / F) TaxID=1149755 RepID=A0A2J6S9V0_HYAVF|nr:MFS general substrate transporter [Hyaloscypha variabilis F]